VPSIQAFLASNQTGIAQLAIKYCSQMVEDDAKRAAFFPGLNLSASPSSQKNLLIDPLMQKILLQKNGVDLLSQPADAGVRTEIGGLIDKLAGSDTRTVAKAVCGAALGSGVLAIK
jgi:hypothetical protein